MPFSCMLPKLQDQARRMFKALNPVGSLEVGPTLRIYPAPAHHHACIYAMATHSPPACMVWRIAAGSMAGVLGHAEAALGGCGGMLAVQTDCVVLVSACACATRLLGPAAMLSTVPV